MVLGALVAVMAYAYFKLSAHLVIPSLVLLRVVQIRFRLFSAAP